MNKILFLCGLRIALLLVSFCGLTFNVRADDASNSTFSIPLIANKWNLVSIPYDVFDERIEAVLGDADSSVDTIYAYDAGKWYVYRADHPELSTLKIIEPGYGYFIHASSSANINGRGTSFLGSSTPPSRHLVSGWNLVGPFVPEAEHSYDIDEVFSSIGFSGVDYLALWGMDTTTESFTTKESVRQGDAFWILLDAPHVYGPSSF
jgi:hypothetical protein